MELLLLTDEACPKCNGSGILTAVDGLSADRCSACAGTGRRLIRLDPAVLDAAAGVASLARRVDELERKASR